MQDLLAYERLWHMQFTSYRSYSPQPTSG